METIIPSLDKELLRNWQSCSISPKGPLFCFGISSTEPRTDGIVDATAPRKKDEWNGKAYTERDSCMTLHVQPRQDPTCWFIHHPIHNKSDESLILLTYSNEIENYHSVESEKVSKSAEVEPNSQAIENKLEISLTYVKVYITSRLLSHGPGHNESNGRRIPVPHSRVYRGRGLKAGGSKSTFGDKGDECPGLRRWVEFSPTSPTSGAEPLHSLARHSMLQLRVQFTNELQSSSLAGQGTASMAPSESCSPGLRIPMIPSPVFSIFRPPGEALSPPRTLRFPPWHQQRPFVQSRLEKDSLWLGSRRTSFDQSFSLTLPIGIDIERLLGMLMVSLVTWLAGFLRLTSCLNRKQSNLLAKEILIDSSPRAGARIALDLNCALLTSRLAWNESYVCPRNVSGRKAFRAGYVCSVAKNMKRKISFYMLLLSLSSLFLVEVACFQAIWASFATVLTLLRLKGLCLRFRQEMTTRMLGKGVFLAPGISADCCYSVLKFELQWGGTRSRARPLQDKTKSGLSSPGRTQRFEKQRARIRSSLVQSSCGLLKASTSLVILIQSGDTGLLMTGLGIRAFKRKSERGEDENERTEEAKKKEKPIGEFIPNGAHPGC
ncbi:hypothetical protein QYF36_001706 [Acer negundo]|nr:hypothetical protein QYF36_001706 [Acer negundo]